MRRSSWWGIVAILAGLFNPPAAVWAWPVSGSHVVLRDFVAPETPWGPGHRGIDMAAQSSTLRAPVSGQLRFVGEVVNRGVITIETRDGYLVSMEPVSTELATGSSVSAGQVIGRVDTGHCQTRCLHVGLRSDGHYVSPLTLLGYERRAILLPWP